jgi:hypothetical protein
VLGLGPQLGDTGRWWNFKKWGLVGSLWVTGGYVSKITGPVSHTHPFLSFSFFFFLIPGQEANAVTSSQAPQ